MQPLALRVPDGPLMPAAGGWPRDSIPVLLPHFRLRGDELCFFAGREPVARLDERERALWEAVDGARPVGDLAARFPQWGEPVLRSFVEHGWCAVVPGGFPPGRRRVLVVEPHMDDAALSLGATLWRRRAECEFTVATVAGRSNYTRGYYLDLDFFDPVEVAALRRAESELFVRHLGGRHLALDRLEGPLRYRSGEWSLDWFRRHRWCISSFISSRAGPGELPAWTAAIRACVDEVRPDELWLPLGVGTHVDHELTRNAGLSLLVSDPGLAARCAVRLYEEALYAGHFPSHRAAIVEALGAEGASLEPEPEPMADAFADKLRLVSLFASQADVGEFRPWLESAARAAGAEFGGSANGLAEVLYHVVAAPRRLDVRALYADRETVREIAARLGPWLARNREAPLVRLLVQTPPGRWADAVGLLCRALPRARLEAHVSAAAAPGTEGFGSPRLAVRPVARGRLGWVRRAAALWLRRSAPTVVVAGPDRDRLARLLAAAAPLGDRLRVPSLNHLALALDELLEPAGREGRAAS